VKCAEAVAKRLEEYGIKHIFGVNGGANLHLIHGICDVTGIAFIPTAHEQGAGFAADAYARLRGFAVATGTSGPGATNLVTSIAAAWQDSIPVLYIVGNVATFRRGRAYGVRAYGFQELEFVDMVKGITKAAVEPDKAEYVLPELDRLIRIAQQGRKGPVVLSIPDDLQRAEVEFTPGIRLGGWG
jgi:acetolactate synthase-1/2/3 large subunit